MWLQTTFLSGRSFFCALRRRNFHSRNRTQERCPRREYLYMGTYQSGQAFATRPQINTLTSDRQIVRRDRSHLHAVTSPSPRSRKARSEFVALGCVIAAAGYVIGLPDQLMVGYLAGCMAGLVRWSLFESRSSRPRPQAAFPNAERPSRQLPSDLRDS